LADVFLSYRNTVERRAFVKRLALLLRAHEVSVWWDYGLEAGESYRAQITEELSVARIVAPLWCAESITSKWVPDLTSGRLRDPAWMLTGALRQQHDERENNNSKRR